MPIASAVARWAAESPKRLAETKAPPGPKLARKASPSAAADMSPPPPKSTLPVMPPVSQIWPVPLTTTPVPAYSDASPKRLLQTCLPALSSFTRKMSEPPALVSAPPPQSIVPWNAPVTITFPCASNAAPRAA